MDSAKKRVNVEKAQNFMRQYRDPESRELKKLSANQFMDVWSHYDKDGKMPRHYLVFISEYCVCLCACCDYISVNNSAIFEKQKQFVKWRVRAMKNEILNASYSAIDIIPYKLWLRFLYSFPSHCSLIQVDIFIDPLSFVCSFVCFLNSKSNDTYIFFQHSAERSKMGA
jgi:hypothetical protein